MAKDYVEEELDTMVMPAEGPVGATDVSPEEEAMAAEEAAVGTIMSHTIDELPELQGKQVGDEIIMRVSNVSEDGNTYDLEIVTEQPLPEAAPEPGAEAVTEAMIA